MIGRRASDERTGAASGLAHRLGAFLMGLPLLAGCASLPERPPSGASPLVYDAEDVAEAERVVIELPGVLNSIDLFDKTLAWREDGVAIVRYRYPGMDGLAVDHRLTAEAIVAEVRDFVDRYPDKQIALLGFSAGGFYVLEVAKALADRHPRVVVMAGATGFPQTVLTGLRTARAVVVIGVSEGTTDIETIWKKYFPSLLFGTEAADDPAMQALIRKYYDPERDTIIIPDTATVRAQTGDLTWRRMRVDEALRGTPVLFIHGVEDPVVPIEDARDLAARLPNARLVELEGQGHLIFLTTDEAFDLAHDFLLEDAASGG